MISRKPTLGSIFKHSLIDLMDTIGKTNVHYIRCIKPNEAKVAWEFEAPMVLSQLRACGVLETIRISCLGYPSRWTFEEFADRYYALVPSNHWDSNSNIDVKELCQVILNTCIKDTDKYQVGQTKIFFRAGQLAYFEKLRSDRFNACATVLQKNIRRYVYRHRYLRARDLVLHLQCVARKRIAEKKLESLKQQKAAIIIQSNFRRCMARKQFLAKKEFVLCLQTVIRARKARQERQYARENLAAIQIQRHVRGMIARKWYNNQLAHIIHLQSCIRLRIAQKQLLALRAEAKSANHFKEISYKLENKVVELTQTVTTLKSENKQLTKKISQLEGQLEHINKEMVVMETKALESTVSSSELEAVRTEKENAVKEHNEALEKIQELNYKVNELTESLKVEKEKNKVLEAEMKAKSVTANTENNKEIGDLKAQVVALKAQLATAMHTRQASPAKTNNRTTSPSTNSRRHRVVEEHELQDSAQPLRHTGSTLVNRKARRASANELMGSLPKTSIEQIRQAESKSPRPISVGQSNTIAGGKSSRMSTLMSDNPEDEINAILRQEEPLQEEVLEGLIRTLKYPLPSDKNPPSHKEVLFPAHLISMCINDMWRIGYNRESENLLFSVMDAIQKQCLSYSGEDVIIPCAFWITNIHELLSLIVQAEIRIEESRGHSIGWKEFEKLIQTVKFELQCLEDNVYHAWMREIKRKYSKMVVPAVIESQSLPGFITNDTGRFFNKLLLGTTGPAYSMDDLLNFLNKLHRTMVCYFIEPSIIDQVLTEVLKMTGSTTFNDLLMRKNFSSWKRGKKGKEKFAGCSKNIN